MTRKVFKIGTIASAYGNSGHIVVPRIWIGKRVIAMLKSEWDEVRGLGCNKRS
jgi:putative transposon-encoded protein